MHKYNSYNVLIELTAKPGYSPDIQAINNQDKHTELGGDLTPQGIGSFTTQRRKHHKLVVSCQFHLSTSCNKLVKLHTCYNSLKRFGQLICN